MKLVIGLGNPGAEYEQTWHNVGFLVADALAEKLGVAFKPWGPGSNAHLAQGELKGEKVLILKPLTFMNRSGQAAVAAAHFFKVLPEEIVAVHDDLDLPKGDVRLKTGGGDGGHNGLKSLTQHLAGGGYHRVRLGIGRPPHAGQEPADYVLSRIQSADWTMVEDMIQRALRGVEAFAAGAEAFTREMNSLNKRPKTTPNSSKD